MKNLITCMVVCVLSSAALATSSESDSSIATQVVQKAIASTIVDRSTGLPVTTVITHGLQLGDQPPDWAYGMAYRITNRGGPGGFYVYDWSDGAWDLWFGDASTDGPITLVFDWAMDSSDDDYPFLSIAAADAFYAALRDPGGDLADVELVEGRYVHLIGHSRGAVVNGEIARRLSLAGLEIDHVTALDAHPVDGTNNECWTFGDDLGDPTPTIWVGMNWFDNYYRQDGSLVRGGGGDCDPDGIPLYCNYECQLNESVMSTGGYFLEHGDTHLWYHGTIDTSTPACDGYAGDGVCLDSEMRSTWYDVCGQDSWLNQGYYWSRIGGGADERPGSDLTKNTPWSPPILFNGTFDGSLGGDIVASIAGWDYHGGAILEAQLVEGGQNPYMELAVNVHGNNAASALVHNRFYLPEGVATLAFDYMCTTESSSSTVVQLVIYDAVTGDPTFDDNFLAQGDGVWHPGGFPLVGVPGDRAYRVAFSIWDLDEAITLNLDNVTIDVVPVPTGACCVSGGCTEFTEVECLGSGGTFLGAGTTCTPGTCEGNVFYVCPSGCDYDSIQDAIDAAENGDEIIIAAGTYTGSGSSVLNPGGKQLWIHSEGGPEVTIIDCQNTRRGITCTSGESSETVIEGLTIVNGYSDFGGGMHCSSNSNPTLNNCTFTNNTAKYYGGGLYCANADISISACTFENNSALSHAAGGGGMYGFGDLVLTDCTFLLNSSGSRGGGAYIWGDCFITDCSFSNNTALRGGGLSAGSEVNLQNCIIVNNHATKEGGGVWSLDTTLTDCVLGCNTPDNIDGTTYDPWVNAGGNCFTETCDDTNGDGIPDQCDRDDDGVLHVPGEYEDINAAINRAICGQTVLVAPGVYTPTAFPPAGGAEHVVAFVDRPIQLISETGASETTLDALGTSMPTVVMWGEWEGSSAMAIVDGFRITNASFTRGGGGFGVMSLAGSLLIRNCMIEGNSGGVLTIADDLTIANTSITDNLVAGGIAMINDTSSKSMTLTIQNCRITNNNSDGLCEDCLAGGINIIDDDDASMTVFLQDSVVACNQPVQIYEDPDGTTEVVDLGGNCVAFSCEDNDGDGWPDNCGMPGDGVHEVPIEYDTIQSAIDVAHDGDEILIAPGTYTGDGDSVINPGGKRLWIHSSDGPEVTIIDGQNARRGITCNSGETSETVIDGLTITNGYASYGGGMCNNEGSNPTLTNCTFTGNTASSSGGGMYNEYSSSPTLENCTFENNTADGSGGGGMYNWDDSNPTLENCTFTYNTAPYGGGMFCRNSNPALSDCSFDENTANVNGGGMYCYDNSNPTLSDCAFTYNTANNYGGGMHNDASTPTLIDSFLCGNGPDQIYGTWTDGGGTCIAFSCDDSDDDGWPDKCGSIGDGVHEVPSEYPTIQAAIDAAGDRDEILIAPGTYTGDGDSVINPGGKRLWIHSSDGPEVTIIDGQNARRGITCISGETSETVIDGLTITNGYAHSGGGMYCLSSNPTLSDCIFTNNTANVHGGGMYCSNSNPTLTYCLFLYNDANAGGGMHCYDNSNPTLSDCAFTYNTANLGGGMYNWDSGSPTLIDSFLCGNGPDQIYGTWTDGGGTCIAFSCDDSDGDGWPDKCGSIGDGVHEVPSEYPTIQAAIDAAGDRDEILIAPGTYTGDGDSVINPGGKRLWIHSSDGPEVTIIDGQNARRGITCTSGESSETVIDGLTITNGYANSGGGMYCLSSNPTLSNCTFTNNTAIPNVYADGGGMSCRNSNPTLSDCTFTNNIAADNGGGMYCSSNSNPILSQCTFSYNTAPYGGGMYCSSDSNPTLSDCAFTYNTASNYGGGIYCFGSPTLIDSFLCGNTPTQIHGTWTDGGGNTIADVCPCLGDIDADGFVGVSDLLAIIDQWGLSDSPADVNEDGIVDVSDLLIVIDNWGSVRVMTFVISSQG